MARIVSLGPSESGKVYRLDGADCLLGRRLDCHVCIHDQRVSRRHARIRREADGYQMEDLGSCNGTYVNGRRIQGAVRLRHGDEIEIGASRFRVDFSDDMVAAVENASVLIGDNDDSPSQPMIEVALIRQELLRQGTKDVSWPPAGDGAREVERIQRKLQAMYKISETVASTLDPHALLDKVVALLLEVFPQATAAAAVTFDPRSQQLRTQAAKRRKGRDRDSSVTGMNIPQAVVDRVLRQGHGVLLRAVGEGPVSGVPGSFEHDLREASLTPTTLERSIVSGATDDLGAVGWRMGAPLSFRGDHLGILHVEAEAALGYFTQDDLDLLGGLAAQAGVALHLIGLHQRLLARERLDYDLRLARQIQRNLLPRDPPRVTGIDFAVHYEPAFHVGGDFYDFLWLDPNKLALVVGDVSGKAISGALFMARVTSEIRAIAPVETWPRRVLQRVNRALSEVAEDGMFTTAVYLVIDLAQNLVRFSNAGHTTPILRRGGQVIPLEYVDARTMPLGVEVKIDVDEAQVKLLPGDVLMLYTDGIIEARSMSGEFYGQERLQQAVGRCPGGARATLEAVLGDVDRFVEDAPQADDQTVVCLAVSDTSSRRFESGTPPGVSPAGA